VQRLTGASVATGAGGEVIGWLFLAMAHARLGQAAEARQWLEQAAAGIEEALQPMPVVDVRAAEDEERPLRWKERLVLQHLRREAEALLPPAGVRCGAAFSPSGAVRGEPLQKRAHRLPLGRRACRNVPSLPGNMVHEETARRACGSPGPMGRGLYHGGGKSRYGNEYPS
jgi:hypothetical protein